MAIPTPAKPTLAQARKQKGWSLGQLSDESGVAITTILGVERGAKPRPTTIDKLSRALGREPDGIKWPGFSPPLPDTPPSFRQCLGFLKWAGTFTLESAGRTYTPEQLLIGPDDEAAWLQAPATLVRSEVTKHPQPGDTVGYLDVEFMSAIVKGPLGTEIVTRKVRFTIRYTP